MDELVIKANIREVKKVETYTVLGLFRKYGKDRAFSLLPLELQEKCLYFLGRDKPTAERIDTKLYMESSYSNIFDWYLKPRMFRFLSADVVEAPTISDPTNLKNIPLTSKNFKKYKKRLGFKDKSNSEFIDHLFENTFNYFYWDKLSYKDFKRFMSTRVKLSVGRKSEIGYSIGN